MSCSLRLILNPAGFLTATQFSVSSPEQQRKLNCLSVCLSAEAGLFQVLFSVSQQDLLSRLMLFGSAATVDAVCHLNSWGRCSIPIHALQVRGNTQLHWFLLKTVRNVSG